MEDVAGYRIKKYIGEWKQKLIDLTRRNRLLYFKRTKSSTLVISQPEPDSVFSRLVIKEAKWDFWFPLEEENTDVKEDDFDHEKTTTPYKPPKSNELVIEDLNRDELEKVIKNLYRRSSSDYQERGVRTLYLALGLLEWREATASDVIHSPIILVPVELSRTSARDPFCLLPTDEDVVINPALQVKLRRDFKVELPPLPDDWEGFTLRDYFDSVVQVGGKLNWSVKSAALIGLFSFYKIVMYQDLEANEPEIVKHSLISAFAGEPKVDALVKGITINERDLDSIQEPDRMFHILDADSSQQVCIELARQEQSFVLQGPPGTGKSQTISNIIAEFIEAGKTILFVSEKMAALEVVFKRLREAGLGDFCLELHSYKANKREVVKEINRSLEEHVIPKESISNIEFQRLLQLREKLNNYLISLHRIQEPLGESVFNVLGKLVGLVGVPFVPIDTLNLDEVTPGWILELEELVSQLKNVWRVAIEGKNHPWYGCRESRFTLEVQSELTSILDPLLNSVDQLNSLSAHYASSLGLYFPLSISKVDWLVKIAMLLRQCPGVDPSWLTIAELDPLVNEANHYLNLSSIYRTDRTSLGEGYNRDFFDLPLDITPKVEEALTQVGGSLISSDFNGGGLLQGRSKLLEFVKDTRQLIKEWINDSNNLARYLGVRVDNLSLERIKQIRQLAVLCCSEARPNTNWLEPDFLREVKDALPKARETTEEYKRKKRELIEKYSETIIELDHNRLMQSYRGSYKKLFDWLLPAFLGTSDEAVKNEVSPPSKVFQSSQVEIGKDLIKTVERPQVLETFLSLSRELLSDAYDVVRRVGISLEHTTLEQIDTIAKILTETSHTSCEEDWFNPILFKQIPDTLSKAKNDYMSFKVSKEQLMQLYSEDFLELEVNKLIEKYNGIYKTLFRWIWPPFYKDRKAVSRRTIAGAVPESIREDLLSMRELKRLGIRLEKDYERTAQILGRLFQGHYTNFELLESSYNMVELLMKLTGSLVPDELISVVSLNTPPDRELINLGKKLQRIKEEWIQLLQNFLFLFIPDHVASYELLVQQWSLGKIEHYISEFEIPLADLRTITKVSRKSSIPPEIWDDLSLANEVNRMQFQIENESEKLSRLFGSYYRGEATDFDFIERALNVASESLILIGTTQVPTELKEAICSETNLPADLQTTGSRLLNSVENWEHSARELNFLIPLDNMLGTGLRIDQTLLPHLELWANEIEVPLTSFWNLIEVIFRTCSGSAPTDLAKVVSDLKTLDNLRAIELDIEKESHRLSHVFGSRFNGMDTDWNSILSALQWTREIRALFGTYPFPKIFVVLTSEGSKALRPSEELVDHYQITVDLFQSLQNRFENNELRYSEILLNELPLDQLHERLTELRSRIDELQDWIQIKLLENRFVEVGLNHFFQKLVANPPQPSLLIDVFRRGIYQAWTDNIFATDVHLRQFRGRNHEQAIAEFRQLDNKLDRLSAYLVMERANKRKPKDLFIQARDTEIAILRRESAKKRRNLPIRRLFERIPNLLTRLKPCLLMSPLSVSQFLPSSLVKFDLIVFDEASQICTEDAVGSIYRGNQLIVAGDNKQLPPTAFFQQGLSEEYDWDDVDDDEFAIFDSVLDESSSIGLPLKMLRWHYRSKHEALIAYSNKYFYDQKLVTFPSPRFEHETLGVKFVQVVDGIYDRGGRRNNPREASVVADLVFEHFRQNPDKTLGVVALSLSQMTTIEDEIELRRRSQPEFERHFKEDRLEGFFVKNLENVQGDERDIIILSVAYGYDQQGRFPMIFGPLNKPGGERRLNVAITRAREKVILVSSIKASLIDLNKTQSKGVLHLYRYLDYAERGAIALELSHPQGIGEPDSPFEEDVASEIRRMGYEVIPQVGCSNYRIDIGVVDPVEPGRFLLGIECDGATYHSAYTARDRDRIRQQVLESFGWRIHRIWSPDWVNKRDSEIKRIKKAIEDARHISHNPKSSNSNDKDGPIADSDVQIRTKIIKLKASKNAGILDETIPYKVCKLNPGSNIGPEFYLPLFRKEQNRLLAKLVDVEGPIHIKYAARRIVSAWDLERTGRRIVKAIKESVKQCQSEGKLIRRGKFLWPPNLTQVPVRVPTQGIPETFRDIEYIPQEEIKNAMILVIHHSVGISVESVLVETARLFGFNRTGDNIRKQLLKILKAIREEGTVMQHGDSLTLTINNK